MPIPQIDFETNYLKKIKREQRVPSINGELVPLLGISRQRFYDYRNSKIVHPNWSIYFRIADWLGCQLEELIVNLDEFSIEEITATAEKHTRRGRK